MIRAATLAAAAALATTAQAQTFELRRPVEPAAAIPQITGGYKATVANWPATFIFDAVGGGPCTATAIGPQVILTAAHCLPASLSGKVRNTSIVVWCETAPLPGYGYDVALCASSAPIPIASNKPYESIDVGTLPATGSKLAMLGFGCTRVGGADGVLYEGEATMGVAAPDATQFTSAGVPALCSGDSGGGAYSPVGGKRRIVGVAAASGPPSYFTILAQFTIVEFIARWQLTQVDPETKQRIEVKICGIDGTSAYCRG